MVRLAENEAIFRHARCLPHLAQELLVVRVDLGEETGKFLRLLSPIVRALGQEKVAVVFQSMGPLVLHGLLVHLLKHAQHSFNLADQVIRLY